MNFVTKYRRDRWVAQVIAVGRQLRQAEASRRGVDASVWPDDCAYLDARVDRLTRRREGLLDNLRRTA